MITNVSHLLRPSHDRMYADLKHCQLQSQVPVHAVGERVVCVLVSLSTRDQFH